MDMCWIWPRKSGPKWLPSNQVMTGYPAAPCNHVCMDAVDIQWDFNRHERVCRATQSSFLVQWMGLNNGYVLNLAPANLGQNGFPATKSWLDILLHHAIMFVWMWLMLLETLSFLRFSFFFDLSSCIIFLFPYFFCFADYHWWFC